uniref:Low density lipoprotein receptor class A domain containing 4 n=1 Tax=Homo sapiens TaxID=9606 RepID=A0A7I2V3W1_HUMAN
MSSDHLNNSTLKEAQFKDLFLKKAELEFAQIIIIVVVVTVMVVVIVCLLNHYKVSTRSFINRPNQSRRREDGLPQEGCLWPSDSAAPRLGASEVLSSRAGRDLRKQAALSCPRKL